MKTIFDFISNSINEGKEFSWTVYGPDYVDGAPEDNPIAAFDVEDTKYVVVKGDGAIMFCKKSNLTELFGKEINIDKIDTDGCMHIGDAHDYVLKISE